jgi:hypothetical protein
MGTVTEYTGVDLKLDRADQHLQVGARARWTTCWYQACDME